MQAKNLALTNKGLSVVKIASPTLKPAQLNANDEAVLKCQTALEQKDRGDLEAAQKTMRPYWARVGERPKVTGLDSAAAADVLLCVGILTSWIGSKNQVAGAQEVAKNLITQSMTYFEARNNVSKVGIAQSEIAYCYYREGSLNEARSWLHEAIEKLTFAGADRARALLKLSTVEWTSAQFHNALDLLTDNETLFRRITNHTIKGAYFTELAIIHRNLATTEHRPEFFRRAINEYKEAERQFRMAGNQIYRADVINNVGFLFYKIGRHAEAHRYLAEARRLTVRLKEKTHTALIDESIAQVLLAERNLSEAERVARRAVLALERGGHFCLMAEALITQAIAVARSGQPRRAHSIFREAIEAAHRVDAMHMAGLAALALIEEVRDLPFTAVQAAYRQAREWLAGSRSPDIKIRLGDAAERLTASVQIELNGNEATEILLTEPGTLDDKLLKYERLLIKDALAQVNGSVTHAAALLGKNYQTLAFIIESRHKDLLKDRSPVRRRPRKH